VTSEGKRDKRFYEQRASDETARQYRLKPKAIEATFNYFARQILRYEGDGVIE